VTTKPTRAMLPLYGAHRRLRDLIGLLEEVLDEHAEPEKRFELVFRGRTLLQAERRQEVRRFYERLRGWGIPEPS